MRASRSPAAGGEGATLRIIGFYVLLLAAMALLIWRFPSFLELVLYRQPAAPAGSGEITRTLSADVPLSRDIPSGWDSIWVTTISVLGALVIMIPTAWTYILIKRKSGYEESVVHTLLILPVVVAGILIVVQGSLALAFSLAGIVAAVRFRTTLEDTKDAVYIFLAIGVGLAAGVQALGVALALSVAFNVVNLLLWRLNFGNIYADQLHRTGGLGLGMAIAGPDAGGSALAYGSSEAIVAAGPNTLAEVEETQARVREYLKQESDRKKERKQYLALLIYTRNCDAVQRLVEPILEEWTLRWHLAETTNGDDGVQALTYLIRPRESGSESTLLNTIRTADTTGSKCIVAAELRSLKALAKKG